MTVVVPEKALGRRRTGGEAYGLSLASPTNQMSLAYWEDVRGSRLMPARADLEVPQMTRFLRCIILLDVIEDPFDFHYRLIGTKVTQEMVYHDHTGKMMTDIPHQNQESRIFGNCRDVVLKRRPIGGQTPYVGRNSDFRMTEDVIMPLSNDGERVNMLFVTADFIDP